MRAFHKAIGLLAVCLLAIAAAGCVTVRATVSVPRVPAGSTGDVSDGGLLRLTLADLTVSTHMYNYHTTEKKSYPPAAGLWLALEAQGDTFTFDPGLVTLTADNGEPARPVIVIGPATPWESPRSVGMGCGPRRYALGWAWNKIDVTEGDLKYGNPAKGVWKQSPGPVQLRGSTCFVLIFDMDSNPDRTFVLSLQGARKAGDPFRIPDITFSKGSISKSVVVP
jgi:hypothetical protein